MIYEVKTYRIVCDMCGREEIVTRENDEEVLPYEWKFLAYTEKDIICRTCWEKD